MKKLWVLLFIVLVVMSSCIFSKSRPISSELLVGSGAILLERPTAKSSSSKFPLVILAHGCSGIMEVEPTYAKTALQNGWAVLTLNSLAPRHIQDGWPARLTVCSAMALTGHDRTKDIRAVVKYAETQSDIDTNEIVLVGFSHGSWTILDLLSAENSNQTSLLDQISGAYLNYPYCMAPSVMARKTNAPLDIPMHINLGTADKITFATPCKKLVEKLSSKGADLTCHLFDGATHAYDEPTHEGKTVGRVRYHPEYAEASLNNFEQFLFSSKSSQSWKSQLEENCY